MKRGGKNLLAILGCLVGGLAQAGEPYAVPDTGQRQCYDDMGRVGCPSPGQAFFGQDAQYQGPAPQYRNNGDGTVSDLVTGLMWEKSFSKTGFADAAAQAQASRTGGHADWRVPTIKELYSLMNFQGATGSAGPGTQGAPADAKPYIDTRHFNFEYPSQGRFIDAQYVTSTAYLGLTMGRDRSFFGVNFADGRIKAYPQNGGPGGRIWNARYVRGNPAYGKNDFRDNGDGTIADLATGLTWTKSDSGRGLDWGQALAYCESLFLAGHDDWRLPNAKELHSIVDYTRSPSATQSAALDPIFDITAIKDDDGKREWPYFWTSTSHLDGRRPGDFAVYIAFGTAQGHLGGGGMMGGPPGGGMGGGPPGGGMGGPPPGMGGFPPGGMMGGSQSAANLKLTDVHGAGAQRSSPKSGDESRLPKGAGPQGDVLRIFNFARCVRG
ncbi:conserved exported hypothetical protein [Rhodospirillaceae bacterium LM-1]|nr:conserved exported hypothetical protein [Rhodospirillaceae bacterium LM-1]